MKWEEALKPDVVLCISLCSDEGSDKWNKIVLNVGHQFPSVRLLKGVDTRNVEWNEMPIDIFTQFRKQKNRKRKYHHEISGKGCVGCFLSHLKAWHHIVDNDFRDGIIFEDDAIVKSNFDNSIDNHTLHNLKDSQSSSINVILFKPWKLSPFRKKSKHFYQIVAPFYGLSSYWIRKDAAQFLIDLFRQHTNHMNRIDMQVDGYMFMASQLYPQKLNIVSPAKTKSFAIEKRKSLLGHSKDGNHLFIEDTLPFVTVFLLFALFFVLFVIAIVFLVTRYKITPNRQSR